MTTTAKFSLAMAVAEVRAAEPSYSCQRPADLLRYIAGVTHAHRLSAPSIKGDGWRMDGLPREIVGALKLDPASARYVWK